MNEPIVAADTNLLRHPTPRRYLTVLEGLRSRAVVVLPSVDRELKKHLPIQARDYIESMAEKRELTDEQTVQLAKTTAASAAGEWWRGERTLNDPCYVFATDLGEEVYGQAVAQLPGAAFTDDNDSDQWIYAEAMTHNINVLASHNRKTILTEVLDEHFSNRDETRAPITVKTLWDHTVAVAAAEGRKIADVALEAVLCATVPDAQLRSVRRAARRGGPKLRAPDPRKSGRETENAESTLPRVQQHDGAQVGCRAGTAAPAGSAVRVSTWASAGTAFPPRS